MSHLHKEIVLVSACLTGLCTRYDGLSKPSPACMEQLTGYRWIPICPEQLGGLPTPRIAANLVGGDGHDVLAGQAHVIDLQGRDVTSQFIHGANQCLAIAQAQKITTALLKARSPSCGLSPIIGVTAALLTANRIKVIEI
jgi:uncharacterized protein YbbK (DUF523 family)